MTSDDRHEAVEAARLRTSLSVQQLWLRYVALGGSGDAFDVDGYLQGLVSLETFQQDVLAQAVNEALDELHRALRVPLSAASGDGGVDGAVFEVVEQLLAHRRAAPDLTTLLPGNAPPDDEGPPPARSRGSQPER